MNNKILYGIDVIDRNNNKFEICSGYFNGKLAGMNYELVVLSHKDPHTNYIIDYEIDADYVFNTYDEAQEKINELIKISEEAEARWRYMF